MTDWEKTEQAFRDTLFSRVAFRAGWPDRHNEFYPFRRFGRFWIRVGPWVLGDTTAWDESGAA